MSTQPLSPFSLTDWNRAKSYLQVPGTAQDDFIKQCVNQATSKLEELAAMRLRERSFRAPYVVAGCAITSADETVTGPGALLGFTTGTILPRVGDVLTGASIQTSPQAVVASITDNTHLEMSEKALGNANPVTLTFGIGMLKASGTGTSTIVVPIRPVTALYSARYKDALGNYLAIDVTGAILGDDGSIVLRNEWWPAGRQNVEIECVAGWPFDGGPTLQYQHQWQRLESYCLELTRLYFEKYKTGVGQQDWESPGGFRISGKELVIPEHIKSGMLEFAELWP